jgi:hypothetical protein
MKRVLFAAAAACLFDSSGAAQGFPDVANLPLRPEPPDLLRMFNGRSVDTPEQWFEQRRPELKALFQHYMYGWFAAPVEVQGTVTYTDASFFDV